MIILSAVLLASCGPNVTIAGHSFGSQPPPSEVAPPPPATAPPAPITEAPIPPNAAPAAPGAAAAVGLLLPLSGPSAALGQAMLDAAQMALFDVADNPLRLLVRDTKGDPQAAAAAAQSAITDGAKLIIGPLLAGEVEAVKPVAQAASVPVVAFSTATQLAGDGTWLIGFGPQEEVRRVIAYAHARGMNQIGVLAPQSPYGDIALAAAQDAATALGVELSRVGRYGSGDAAADLTAEVQHFASGAAFDALLLPEGGAKLRQVAPLLAFDGIDPDKVKFLGTGLWDEPGLGTEPALEGGWYAAPDPNARASFATRFAALYHHPPPRLATLGYDATALAGVLARNPNGADFSAAALTSPSGFAGLDGIFRLLPNGLVQRGLAILEVHRGASTVVDPAPTSFEELGE